MNNPFESYKMNIKSYVTSGIALPWLFFITFCAKADVTVNFSGKLVHGACTISNDSMDQSIDMKEIYTNDLYRVGRSESFPWKIKLLNCNPDIASYAKMSFEGIADENQPGLLKVTGDTQNVAIGLEDDKHIPILINTESLPFLIKEGDMDVNFFAYIKAAPASIENRTIVGGDFSGTATFSINYE